MPVYFQWIYFLSPFSYAFGAVVINEFENTDNSFSIAIAGVVVPSQWTTLAILFTMGLAWRIFGYFGIIRLFRLKRPGSLSWHQNNTLNQENFSDDVTVLSSPTTANSPFKNLAV